MSTNVTVRPKVRVTAKALSYLCFRSSFIYTSKLDVRVSNRDRVRAGVRDGQYLMLFPSLVLELGAGLVLNLGLHFLLGLKLVLRSWLRLGLGLWLEFSSEPVFGIWRALL